MTRFDSIIRLRRDTEDNYDRVGNSFIPQNGEVCLVDTSTGLKFKVGDGATTWSALDYEGSGMMVLGYFLNGKFYTDSTYTVELAKDETHLYADKNAHNALYIWDGENFHAVTPEATEDLAGIMKLYQDAGQNTDGTMSQKAITDGVNAISFVMVDTDADGEPDCLELDLPWD